MTLLILFLLIALVVSFCCSLLESVILSVSHAYVALLIKEGRRSGHILRKLKKDIDHPLAAILTMNTVANTVGAAGVGAQTFYLFGSRWVALSSAVLTILILVCSEIIPKTIGAAHWKKLAPASAYILQGMIYLLYPVVRILEGISGMISQDANIAHITREEMMVLAEIGEDQGILLHKEARIIQNLLLMTTIRAGDILTPRSVILAFRMDKTVGEVVEEHSPLRFSRIPVFCETRDHIRGMVHRLELIEAYYTGRRDEPLESLLKPIHAIPDSKPIADLLDEFINRREHMFVVVDEYGGTAGIVTLEDAVETLLGVEIMDELDSVEDMQKLALENWRRKNRGRFL